MTESKFNSYLEALREKWKEVPSSIYRIDTSELLTVPDNELLSLWTETKEKDMFADGFCIRGWYRSLYKSFLAGKKVMDVGSGFGVDGITFAQAGAHITFVDIVESNLIVLRRICSALNVQNVRFHYLESLESFARLDYDYDVIWCMGSLINSPFEVTREEVQALVQHLKEGGHWIELGYPESRWEREGRMPFEEWGVKTDGGAPWIEWKDLPKLKTLLEPVEFETLLHFDFHKSDFNWFDLVRKPSSGDVQHAAISPAMVNDLMVAVDREFCQLLSHLTATQAKLLQSNAEFTEFADVHHKLELELELVKAEKAALQVSLQQTQAMLEVVENRVEAMQSSKFWRFRKLWVGLKRTLGVSQE